jgi:hypothetical protein
MSIEVKPMLGHEFLTDFFVHYCNPKTPYADEGMEVKPDYHLLKT